MGCVAEHYGWRRAFMLAGAPGVVLALLFYLTVREPARAPGAPADKGESDWRHVPATRGQPRLWLARAVDVGPRRLYVRLPGMDADLPCPCTRAQHAGARRVYGGRSSVRPASSARLPAARSRPRWSSEIDGGSPLATTIGLLVPSQFLLLYEKSDFAWQAGLALQNALVSAEMAPLYALCLSTVAPHNRATAIAGLLLCITSSANAGTAARGRGQRRADPSLGDQALRPRMTGLIAATVVGALLCWRIARHLRPDASIDKTDIQAS
jgi:hypothetical protein